MRNRVTRGRQFENSPQGEGKGEVRITGRLYIQFGYRQEILFTRDAGVKEAFRH